MNFFNVSQGCSMPYLHEACKATHHEYLVRINFFERNSTVRISLI